MGARRVGRTVGTPHMGVRARYVAWAAVIVAAVAPLVGSAWPPAVATTAPPHPAAPADHTQPDLIDLDGVAGIRAAFNADVGRTRLLLTFSPT